ncbi:MAG TPA: hypothetical protein VD931_16770 [Baekduia sp.]|nr:hypothetical protein [Baekduia sp.]
MGEEASLSAAQQRARKVHKPYAEGELVRVAGGRHQAEAELIQGLLLEEGIPSLLRRSRGFDVPDMLAAGPRDVMVPRGGADAARDVLLQAELVGTADPPPPVAPARLLFWLLAGVAVVALVVWLISALAF